MDKKTDITQVVLDEETIKTRVKELAKEISEEYKGKDLVIIGVLKGAFIFLSDLSRALTIPHKIDFISISSYGNSSVSGAVRFIMDLRDSIEGKHVLIVEDILDTGQTLDYLMETLGSRKPASLKNCVFTRKKGKNVTTKIDYIGFEIPDVWVVGYGLDYAEKYRTLPYVGEMALEE